MRILIYYLLAYLFQNYYVFAISRGSLYKVLVYVYIRLFVVDPSLFRTVVMNFDYVNVHSLKEAKAHGLKLYLDSFLTDMYLHYQHDCLILITHFIYYLIWFITEYKLLISKQW